MIVTTFKFLNRVPGHRDRFTLMVKGFPWCDLPNPIATKLEGCDRPNPFMVPRTYAPSPEELEVRQRLYAEAQRRNLNQRPRARRSRSVAITTATTTQPLGESSSSSVYDLDSIRQELASIRLSNEEHHRRQERELDYVTTYVRGIYGSQVAAGILQPYVNYPHHPPQQGPVPGWQENRPTYPYHPPRPEGLDYRYPGGSDLNLDPNYPPWDTYPVYPPNYHQSVPPSDSALAWCGIDPPPFGNYPTGPSNEGPSHTGPSNMDTDT